ncbi:Similar to SLC27A4: Long-chain fatty acid transport protein 4 (Macaca fascicularis) [Cotesia congregata]|uniref:long-chain-fatty-acid--CoA ligase n=1 Tax=Cotesia congregata TaxID=51543 RepID=A0A8J2HHU2_COTCN|nr:Similar to SLC27A4: Long-chain fatty acid transport protein 4 (Macaca fascicularis) [Cotesia congregata]
MSDTIAKLPLNNINGNGSKINSTKERDVERGEPPSKGGDNSRRSTNGSVDVGSAAAQPGVPTIAGSSPSTCRAIARTFQRIVLAMIALGLLGGLVALVWIFMGPIFVLQLVLVVIVAYFVSGGRLRWFYIAFKTAPRDLIALSRFIRLMWAIKCHEKKNRSVADVFQQFVAKHPNKSCFVFEDREWTFQEIEDLSNKVAYVFKSHGYRKGDVVALLMENRPEYVAIWLGLSKLGVTIPLINTNLRKTSLLHCINVARCQALIFSDELSESVSEIASSLDAKIALYKFDGKPNTNSSGLKEKDLSVLLDDASSSPLVLQEKGTYNDKLMYIYTSGTTGLPKAAVITNYKFMFIAGAMYYLGKFKTSDRFYTPLPLYHTAGGIVAQYIGEMCRYILASPPKPEDKQHKVRAIFGNGLRPQIWSEFIERFNIKQVAEFYGATESNANITNVDNKVGAIGFVSRIIPAVYPISIIKVNADGDPIRNEKGLCQECKPNEPGVFIGKIIPNNPHRAFLGYVDEKASERKVIHNVFKKGDSAFHSGDIVVADEFGYLYFKDRTGDTFRWKGENVSTSEVEAILSNLTNYRDCVVYGVEVTGSEGRAGMAAIHDENETLDLNEFVKNVKENLPSYGRPLFIRILTKIDLTGTFKLKKKDLQEEGYNPRKVNDKLYYLDPKSGYQLITPEVYDQILQGKIRF